VQPAEQAAVQPAEQRAVQPAEQRAVQPASQDGPMQVGWALQLRVQPIHGTTLIIRSFILNDFMVSPQ
jgi:hypothetical protein